MVKWPFSHLIVFIWHRLYSLNPDHFHLESLTNSQAEVRAEEVEWWWCPLENDAFSSFNDREKKSERKSRRYWINAIKKSLREKKTLDLRFVLLQATEVEWWASVSRQYVFYFHIQSGHHNGLTAVSPAIDKCWVASELSSPFTSSRTPQHLLFLLFHWNAFVAEHMELTVTRTQWYIYIEKWKGGLTNKKTLVKRMNVKNNNSDSGSSIEQESSTHKQKMRTVNCVYFWCQRVTGRFQGTFT